MATATISSTFDIVVIGPADLNVAKVITCPRPFQVVGCSATNEAAGASTLNLVGSIAGQFTTDGAGAVGLGVVQAQAVAGPMMPVGVLRATNISAGETITLTTGHVTVIKVVLHCVGSGGGQAISIV